MTDVTSRAEDGRVTHVVDPIDKYSALIVRRTIVGTGLIGVALFLRNSRIFSKFEAVGQIPKEFIRKELELKGKVREVVQTGELLIEHQPIVRLPRLWPRRKLTDKTGLLKVRLAALDISKAGQSYLARDLKLSNRPITFTVIRNADAEDAIDCDVTYKKNTFTRTNLNVDLVRRGYARVPPLDQPTHLKALQSIPSYSRLVQRLLMSEKVADRRGVGVWERDTWVEQMQSYPSAVTGIIKAAPITRFIVLVFSISRDVLLYGIHVTRQTWHLLMAMAAISANAYRKFAAGVDRASNAYARLRSKVVK